jgi:hypothetical protein
LILKFKVNINRSPMKTSSFQAVPIEACRRFRVAEGEIAAVDLCDCGAYQLHLGAMTLRLAPEALSSLLSTLGEAVAVASARRACAPKDDGGVLTRAVRDARWERS